MLLVRECSSNPVSHRGCCLGRSLLRTFEKDAATTTQPLEVSHGCESSGGGVEILPNVRTEVLREATERPCVRSCPLGMSTEEHNRVSTGDPSIALELASGN